LFLTSYDELFRFNTTDLSLARYLDWGIGNILSSKLTAFGFDMLVLLFGALQIFLAPFAALGLWRLRQRVEFKPMLIYLALLIIVMPLVFTFPSVRGSMLHSSAALVAYFAVAVPPGLGAVIEWIAQHRRAWNAPSAQKFFGAGFVALSFILSLFLYTQGVFGDVFGGAATIPLWNARDAEYAQMARELNARKVSASQPVMTVDPPSFRNDTGRRSIYLPTDSVEAIFQAAKQFDAHYLVLQYDHPRPLSDLYSMKTRIEGLVPVAQVPDPLGRPVTLFEIKY
jgi:hypothetical protein